MDGLKLSGGSLSQPIQIQKVLLDPAAGTNGQGSVLAGTANVPAGAPAPLVFTVRLSLTGYQVTARGAGSPARVRQLAHAAGLKEAGALDAIAGDPLTMDLAIEGPWLPAPDASPAEGVSAASSSPAVVALATSDRLTGTVTLHDANWKTDALATAVEIPEATLHLGGGAMIWDPVDVRLWSAEGNGAGRDSGLRGGGSAVPADGGRGLQLAGCRGVAGDLAGRGKEGNTAGDGDRPLDAVFDASLASLSGNAQGGFAGYRRRDASRISSGE